ncbi:IclR family transcriptional regulator [Caldimonas sp. KR1-144]|uniref:IclR family transcriptional regulator n=1 Tax=Caldimonas sp. KR1-144 TaxID=3400911 RepID=UPI003C047CE6
MTSPSRVLAILDLFTRERPVWQPDEINDALGYARPTGYRYVKELVDAGLLQKVSAGRYALGARIIELDYQLRQGDPLLLAAVPVMERLAADTGYDVVLSVMFAGPAAVPKVIDVHRVTVEKTLALAYGRGRPRPLFRSGAPKVLLAAMARAPLVKLHAARADEIAASGMGRDWTEFRAYLTQVRKQGWYRSSGELEKGIGAIAVPVPGADEEVVAALALVGRAARIDREDTARLAGRLQVAAETIRRKLGSVGRGSAAA